MMGCAQMDQGSMRFFAGLVDPVTEPVWVEFAGGLTHIARRGRDEPDALGERVGDEEADYCRARAEAEAKRADEAVHPAARQAHLEMAALYHGRALATRQVDDPAVQDWMSEGGGWLADA
jgi:hypothetical protein